MQPYEANLIAIGGFAKAIRLALLKLGMRRCSLQLIHRQAEAPIPAVRLSWYCAFWRWFLALWMAHRQGAEFLFEDFCARVQALRDMDDLQSASAAELLAEADGEHGDIVRAAFLNEETDKLMREIAEDIVVKRKLLAFYAARQMSARRAA
ncbi:MAG TPA: hypothetical protein VGB17_14200 [Pyrinomonadaceae bacterium]|jgi:hypothetical protein